VRSNEYCTGLFVCGLEGFTHLVMGEVCVAEVRGGGWCWGLCVFTLFCELIVYMYISDEYILRNVGLLERASS